MKHPHLDQAEYLDIRAQMQPGDIIAFNGRRRISSLIRLATFSNVTHIGIVFRTRLNGLDDDTIEIMESCKQAEDEQTGQLITGVIRSRLSHRLRYYYGDMWWLPLSFHSRLILDYPAAVQFLMSVHGRPYDMPQAIRSAIDSMDSFQSKITYACEDYSSFFCSELAAAALKAGGVLPQKTNPSEMTPIDLCRLPIYFKEYYQIKGSQPVAINF